MILIPRGRDALRACLAWYQLLAGLVGVCLVVAIAPGFINSLAWANRVSVEAAFAIMISLFAIVGVSGALIAMRSPWGTRIAATSQILQVPLFALGPFKWMFFAGAYGALSWDSVAGWSTLIGLKADVQLAWSGPQPSSMLGVNVLPILVLWLLFVRLPASESNAASRLRNVGDAGQSGDLPGAGTTASSRVPSNER